MSEETELPSKNDLQKHWVDDARIAAKINEAIELAEQSKWEESEARLVRAEEDLEDWQPYDSSDVYYKGIWKGQIAKVRKYHSERNPV